MQDFDPFFSRTDPRINGLSYIQAHTLIYLLFFQCYVNINGYFHGKIKEDTTVHSINSYSIATIKSYATIVSTAEAI